MAKSSGAMMLDYLAMLCWLLKDLGWAATCWPLAVPAAVSSFIFQSFGFGVALIDGNLRSEECVFRIAMLGWIVGNATWMMSEFLFEAMKEPSRHWEFWNKGPILHVSHEGYGRGLLLTRVTLLSTLAFLFVYVLRGQLQSGNDQRSTRRKATIGQGAGREHSASYGSSLGEGIPREKGVTTPSLSSVALSRGPVDTGARAQDLFHIFFVTIWIVKDICWTFESLAGALWAAIALITLSLNHIRMKGLVDPGMQISELLWVLGNTVWAISEVWDGDLHTGPRFVACLLLLAGCLVASFNVSFGHCVRSLRTQNNEVVEEVAPLLGDAKGHGLASSRITAP